MKRQRAVTKEDLDAIEGREETRMEIVQVSLDDLHPYANNPRKNEKAVEGRKLVPLSPIRSVRGFMAGTGRESTISSTKETM